ncbi:MAG: hypothetical protein EOO08_11455 [Chitinophagaceae bacterium]|nr:MAG: hypothetical protein EOO08_11455 [Chitinophagaceae bacterium]
MHLPGRKIRGYLDAVDGQLLLFLVLLCNVKLVVKALALLLLLWRHRAQWSTVLRRPQPLVLLYPALAVAGVLSAILAGRFSEPNYGWAFLGSEGIWIACGICALGMQCEANARERACVWRTVEVFLMLNAFVSFAQLAGIIIETGALNPYRYQGNHQKYFINTGDYIKGISFDTSTCNAVLCAIGVLVFTQRRRWATVAVLLCALVLTASNLVFVLTLAGLAYLALFRSTRAQKSILALFLLPFILFWARISPQNSSYVATVLGMTTPKAAAAPVSDAVHSVEGQREAYARHWIDSVGAESKSTAPENVHTAERPALPTDNIHSAAFQHRDDSGAARQLLQHAAVQLATEKAPSLGSKPGKLLALQTTMQWLRENPSRIITGNGPAAFSSKMAFKATGLGIAGSYPAARTYRSADFEKGHLALYLTYFAASEKLHSVVHSPNSVYLQLLGEYGLLGLLLLAAYFAILRRNRKRLSVTLPLIALLAALLATDYWFEQLSVIPLLELLFFLDLRPNATYEAA